MNKIGLVLACAFLGYTIPASLPAQICGTPDIGQGRFLGVEMTSSEVIPGTSANRCLNTWNCDRPTVGDATVSSVVQDPNDGSYTVEMRASLRIPGNIDQTNAGFPENIGRSVGYWFDADEPTFPCTPPPPPSNCPNFLRRCGGGSGTAMNFDVGDAFFRISGLSCDTLDTDTRLRTYTFDLYGCDLTDCPRRRADTQFDFTAQNLASILRCDPPRDSCNSCGGCPLGGGGPPGGGCGGNPWSPGKCGSGGGSLGAGMSVAGDALTFTLPNSGPGAILRYRGRGPGDPGHSVAQLPGLGRYWSHDMAELIFSLDPVADRTIGLVTRAGTVHQFEDEDEDDTYEIARPSDDDRQVTKTATGWDIRFLDGTIQRHDSFGRWSETIDPNGNTSTASYNASNLLETVTFPDGRSETFTYDGGLLDTITENGVAGGDSRTWTYTWTVAGDLERVDRPDGTAWVLFYEDTNLPGYLTRVELEGDDDTSRRIARAWRYDMSGNAIATWRGALLDTDPTAIDVWTFAYNRPLSPTITTVTDPLGQVSTYTLSYDTFSAKPRVTKIEGDCPTCGLGPNSQLFYDDDNNPLRPTRIIDGSGTETLLAYDPTSGQLTSRVEAVMTAIEREITWTHDPSFPSLVTSMSQPSTTGNMNDFRVTTTVYTPAGNAETQTISGFEDGQPFNLTTTTVFTAEGLPDTIDPPGFGATDITDLDYDPARGNVILASRTDPLIGATTFGYDPFNRRTSVTDPNGVITETEYDDLDRVARMIERAALPADDLVTEHRYTTFGDLFQTVLPEGNVIEHTYDHVGRLIAIERKADDQPTTRGERSFFTLDDIGNRTREEQQRWDAGAGAWETFSTTDSVYSTRCFLDRTIEGAGSANESVTEFGYDCDGNLDRIWDPNHPSNGQVNPPSTVLVYDDLDRLAEMRQPFGLSGVDTVTTYGYDVQDHLTSVTDGEGTVTTFVYSDRDLVTEQTSEVSGTSSFVYNEHGELTEETDARMITTVRTVDELDRVTSVDYPDDTLDITYTYDDPAVPFSIGRLTAIARNGTSVDYGYDRFGRLTQDGALTLGYDKNGNASTIDYPSGVSTTTTYDFADRPATLDATLPSLGAMPIVTTTAYLPSGPVEALTLGNGIVETRTHDERYFPDRITAGPGAGPPLFDWDYTTDEVGNVTAIADDVTPANNRVYGYQDVQYYLTQGDGPWGSRAWTYDEAGNRLTETRDAGTDTYTYVLNALGGNAPTIASIALSGGGTRDYTFDPAGNQTRTDDPMTPGATTLDSTYDDASRLTSTGDGVFLVEHTYDGRGFLRRSERTLPGALFADSFESGDTACWSETVGGPMGGTCPDPPLVEPTYSSDGKLHHLVRGFGDELRWVLYHGDRPVALIRQIDTDPPEVTYLTTDHLGTPALATNPAGTETWQGGFEPFGADFAGADGANVFLRFPGQWDDSLWDGTEQTYNVHRWYQPGAAVYARPDPEWADNVILESPTNLPTVYGYVDQRPTARLDPLGLVPIDPIVSPKCRQAFDNEGEFKEFLQSVQVAADRAENAPPCRNNPGPARKVKVKCGTCKGNCGRASPSGSICVNVAMNLNGQCGSGKCLGSTTFHEFIHQCGGGLRNEPMAWGCEKIFYGDECSFEIPEEHKRCPNPCAE